MRKVHAQGCLFLIIPYKLNNFCCNSAHQYNSETEDEEENLFFLVKQEKVSHLAEIWVSLVDELTSRGDQLCFKSRWSILLSFFLSLSLLLFIIFLRIFLLFYSLTTFSVNLFAHSSLRKNILNKVLIIMKINKDR